MRRLKKSSKRTNRPPRSGNRWLPCWSWDRGVDADRRGTVLIVVLALLGLLALIGVTFYTFANQEENNAEYYAGSAKNYTDPNLDANIFFDWSLKQVIMGAPDELKHSPLYGGRDALMANMVGNDYSVASGPGINLIVDPDPTNRRIVPDQNFDHVGDNGHLLATNNSPAAHAGAGNRLTTLAFPPPNVDYTAPDINSKFLAYRGYALDDQNRPVLVVLPSYHRPQYLRQDGSLIPIPDATNDNNTRHRLMRPHRLHQYVSETGTAGARRFIHPHELTPDADLDASERLYAYNATLANVVESAFPMYLNSQGVWNMQVWQPGATYRLGDWVTARNGSGGFHDGLFYKCTRILPAGPPERTRGTSGSGSTFPPSPVGPGGVFTDNEIEWTAFDQPAYEFDADADGDGIKEAVYLDLDFPIQELGDGRSFVPMFAITIYDADGLLSLNAHGNTNGNPNVAPIPAGTAFGQVGGQVLPLSQSNQGLFPSEVNVQYGLNARPAAAPGGDRSPSDTLADVFNQHNWFYRRNVTDASHPLELSNMEWYWLNVGRLQFFDATNYDNQKFVGRYGEESRLAPAWADPLNQPFSRPGATFSDDNYNRGLGTALGEVGTPFTGAAPRLYPFGLPLDFRGTGLGHNNRQAALYQYTLNGFRGNWPQFAGYTSRTGTIGFIRALDGTGSTDPNQSAIQTNLMVQPDQFALRDETAEMGSDPLLQLLNDEIFEARDNAFLQASNTDLATGVISSRLQQLAPYNFQRNVRAAKIREQFTTTSYGLKARPSTFDRNWGKRQHEFAVSGGYYVSPPPFSGMGTDPFRNEVRRLLTVLYPQTESSARQIKPNAMQQRKLSLNHILDQDGVGNLIYRELIEHPRSLPNTPLTNPGPAPRPVRQEALTTAAQQEWYARRDRQLLARDIYTLLYFYGNGRDGMDTFSTPNVDTGSGRPVYSEAQLKEMAQFAVNYVDALDSDHVISVFEYDKNLADGWNLDDDAFSQTGDSINTSDPPVPNDHRAVAYGVETQLLTFSEVLGIKAHKVDDPMGNGQDHLGTQYDDREDRYFTFIELRNPSPLTTSFNNDCWRIVVEPYTDAGTKAAPTERRHLTFRGRQVEGGTMFTVLAPSFAVRDRQNMNNVVDSYFRVDPNFDPMNMTHTFAHIAPVVPPAGGDKLDLGTGGDDSLFTLTDATTQYATTPMTQLRLLDGLNLPANVNGVRVNFKLERRLHLGRQAPTSDTEHQDNPWVTVDTFELPELKEFDLPDENATAMDIQTRLDRLVSKYRQQPFTATLNDTALNSHIANSIAEVNASSIPLAQWNWQWQFNRPFASDAELFSVPLIGPDQLVANTSWRGTRTAGVAKFLQPEYVTNVMLAPGSKETWKDNRWYRLFNFASVPDRVSRKQLPPNHELYAPGFNPADSTDRRIPLAEMGFRTAGEINWNTIRHPAVWAGLVDDDVAFSTFRPIYDPDDNPAPAWHYLPDTAAEPGRDWWVQFLTSRDGLDPMTGLRLPGMPLLVNTPGANPRLLQNSPRPFRSLNFLNHGSESLDDTLLRSLPVNQLPNASLQADIEPIQRRLLELRSNTDVNNGTAIDHYTRHRLLAKAMNHSTTRSNVFLVFVKVDYFEALDIGGGEIRIGGMLAESPGHRGFFVVDRTLGLNELEAADFKTPASDPDVYTLKDTFDFNSVILHRQQLD